MHLGSDSPPRAAGEEANQGLRGVGGARQLPSESAASVRRLRTSAESIFARPAFSYLLIVALQTRVVWNVWRYKDFTPGDTSFYFIDAQSWAHGLHENLIYSPLYDAVWGTVLATVHGAYAAAMVNRLAIVLAAALLFLAAMRSLFSATIALLLALWWVVIPANFNVLYDVHLFGLLPILIAAVVLKRMPGRNGAGIALALLLGDTVLLRNEMLVASVLFAAGIGVYEFRSRRRQRVGRSVYARAYALPLAIALLLMGGAYWRSYFQGETAVQLLEAKQTTNFCEAYAFSYQQRYPARVPGNAFLGCSAVVQHDFGQAKPSLLEAATANPRALAGFVAWNARLLPSGLEVALFNATTMGMNPAYIPTQRHRTYPFMLSVALIVLLVSGLTLVWRERAWWRRAWLPQRVWPLLVLGCCAVGTLIVVLTERPWAEYMYPVTTGVLVLVGLSASAGVRRLNQLRPAAPVVIVVASLLIVVLPSFYSASPRPIYDATRRLNVIEKQLQRQGSVLVADANGGEICNYLSRGYGHYCTSLTWPEVRSRISGAKALGRELAGAKATAVYADATMVSDPAMSALLANPRLFGWQQVAAGRGQDGPWLVLIRSTKEH